MTDSTSPYAENHLGLPVHPTDSLTHWSDREQKTHMLELRKAFDVIKDAGFGNELVTLLDASYQAGKTDEAESHAGPDI